MSLERTKDYSLYISYVTITQLSLSHGFFLCSWIANHDTFDVSGHYGGKATVMALKMFALV